jgi:hypothetical protein
LGLSRKTATAIVLTTTAGKAVTVNVSSTTKYVAGGVSNASLASIAVGNRVSVQGTTNADGSINATVVRVGTGRGLRNGPGGGRAFPPPGRSAAPSGASI